MTPRVPIYVRLQIPCLFVALLVAAFVTGAWAFAGAPAPLPIPAGTRLTFHVDAPISSSESETGQTFSFELLEPIALADRSIPVAGTTGLGTIFLAGRAGTSGHEGDLTLRLDRLMTQDGSIYAFDDQRFQINGRNRKVTSGLLGVVPFVGVGARFIRGSDIRVETTTAIDTVLARQATVSTDLPHF